MDSSYWLGEVQVSVIPRIRKLRKRRSGKAEEQDKEARTEISSELVSDHKTVPTPPRPITVWFLVGNGAP